MEFWGTAEAQRDELLQRTRRKGLPVRTGQRRVKVQPAWLRDADLAAQKYTEAVVVLEVRQGHGGPDVLYL